ncbi:MAG: hypothetical protein KatS3mg099_337 [Candidatus Parcubacteria bacterium]|nr:MAG: hypothetical protein KatS3mg099_337 [Candidatus Parcubacteria bacterium]
MQTTHSSLVHRLVRWGLILLPVLALVVLPWGVLLPLNVGKYAIVILGSLVVVALGVIVWLQQRHIALARWWPLWTPLALPVAYALATLFSPHPTNSFFGESFAFDAFLPMASVSAVAVLAALVLRTRKEFLSFFAALFFAYWIAWLYAATVSFYPQPLVALGIAVAPTLVGSWVHFAMWSGLMAVLSLVALVGFTFHEPRVRIAIAATLALALVALGIANVSYLWWLVGAAALATFVYSITTSRYIRPSHNTPHSEPVRAQDEPSSAQAAEAEFRPSGFSVASLLTLAITLVFLLSGFAVSAPLASFFGVTTVDVRPSWQATADMLQTAYDSSPFFGVGPSLFWREWVQHRSVGVNATPFWNTEFLYTTGFIPTTFITTGIIGALAWILILIAFLWSGFRALVLRPTPDPLWYLFTLASFVGGVYLAALAVISTPSFPLVLLLFVFLGVFYATLRNQSGGYTDMVLSFTENPRVGFVVVLGLTVLFLASVVGLFVVGQRVLAEWYTTQAQLATTTQEALAYLDRASRTAVDDGTFRFAATLQLNNINEVLNDEQLSDEERRAKFQELVTFALQNAQRAIAYDPKDYRNYVVLAQVYEALTALQVPEAYDRAKEAYEKARELNPTSPELLLGLARLEVARKEYDAAKDYINQALALKGDYTPAIFLLAQIQIQEGKTDEAIRSVEATTLVEPSNPVNYFQLGILHYNEKNYRQAAGALRRAVALNPDYANALFFLGLAEYEIGEKEQAQRRFEKLAELDPQNELVQRALRNLKEGRAPLAQESSESGAPPAVGTLDELPVNEPSE